MAETNGSNGSKLNDIDLQSLLIQRLVQNQAQSSSPLAMVMNQNVFSRRKLLQMFSDTKRDIEEECGYPKHDELTATNYNNLYDRDPIAARVVELYPSESWSIVPEVYENEELEEGDENEDAYDETEQGKDDNEPIEGDVLAPPSRANFPGKPKPKVPATTNIDFGKPKPTDGAKPVPPDTGEAEPGEPVDAELKMGLEAEQEGSAFEEAWEQVGKDLCESGYYKGEEGHPVWEYLERADILSGIGRYGVIVLGIDDKKALSEPLTLADVKPTMERESLGVNAATGEEEFKTKAVYSKKDQEKGKEVSRKLLFLRVLDESQAPITDWDTNQKSTRYGKPLMYSITISGSMNNSSGAAEAASRGASDVTDQSSTHRVHWTRVVHLADNLKSNESLGLPRMQQVYNRLYDLHKLYGGSAEMFYQGAFGGIVLETHPQLGGDVDIDVEGVRQALANRRTGLQRDLLVPGMHANSLAPTVADPTAHIDAQLQAICIRLGVPKRVFEGSERGELSSNQDIRQWYGKVKKRQNRYNTPKVVVPFINRLIQIGVLPVPEQFYVYWPDVSSVTDLERADIAVKKTEAITKYIQGSCDSAITIRDWWVRIVGVSEEEADQIIRNKMKELEGEGDQLDIHAREDALAEEEAIRAQEQAETAAEQFEAGREDTAADRELALETAKMKLAKGGRPF